jgi:ABC-type phosphate transport system auxiliary subunit
MSSLTKHKFNKKWKKQGEDLLMGEIVRINQETQSLELENKKLQNDIELLKKELRLQLDARESELNDYEKLQIKYSLLEKRYNSIRNSVLGKLTVKYWKIRKTVSK